MLATVLMSPELVGAAKQAGVYAHAANWLAARRMGAQSPFPYAKQRQERDTIQHDTPRWSMYSTPVRPQQRYEEYREPAVPQRGTELIVSPAAKAMDYFQQSLALLGIDETEHLTAERLKRGYKAASLRAHPDKGGSKEAFDEVRKAFQYVEKILARVAGPTSAAEKAKMSATVSIENARAARVAAEPVADAPPVQLSAKKLDMNMFNRLFEENRLPDPTRDSGYGDWLKGQGGDEGVGAGAGADPRLKGKFNQQLFEQVFREKAAQQTAGTAIMKRLEPDALISAAGTELGAASGNFTAAFGADTQFTDLKEAYTTGATVYQEVADVRVVERGARSVSEAEAMRAREMARVDPDESVRIAAAAAALEERERQRRMRLAQQDTAQEAWAEQMKRRLLVNRS